jgi:hypothetical protein
LPATAKAIVLLHIGNSENDWVHIAAILATDQLNPREYNIVYATFVVRIVAASSGCFEAAVAAYFSHKISPHLLLENLKRRDQECQRLRLEAENDGHAPAFRLISLNSIFPFPGLYVALGCP